MINEPAVLLHTPNRERRGRKAGNEKLHKGRDTSSST